MYNRTIYLRFRYYIRKFCIFLMFCPDCFHILNFTAKGRAICPKCGKAK